MIPEETEGVVPVIVASSSTGEVFTVSRCLTEHGGISSFVVRHEEVAPGRRTSSPHAHTKKDEFFYVLTGSLVLYVNGTGREIHGGEFVAFGGGDGDVHHFTNETDDVATLLSIGSSHEGDVVHYGR